MQGMQRTDGEIGSMFEAAKRMAGRYGRIGLLEPDDVVQSAMLKLLNKNDGRQTTIGWLYKVVRSAAMDAGRCAARDARAVWRNEDEDGVRCVCERADEHGYLHMHGTYIGRKEDVEIDLMSQLKDMLGKLSDPLRQVLVLHSEGFSYQEIASLTGANIGTVRSRLHYARKKAKDLLGDMV